MVVALDMLAARNQAELDVLEKGGICHTGNLFRMLCNHQMLTAKKREFRDNLIIDLKLVDGHNHYSPIDGPTYGETKPVDPGTTTPNDHGSE